MVSATLWAAFVRGLATFGVALVGAFYVAYQALPDTLRPGQHWHDAFLAALGSAAIATAFRVFVEGSYDAWRQSQNKQTTADVSAGSVVVVAPGRAVIP